MFVADSKRLTHAGAKKIADTAVAKARQAGIAISVAVADSGGHLIVLERMDGGRFHSLHSATTKAVCAASNKRPTSSHGAQGQALDVAHALGLALAAGPGRWTAMEGGCPVFVESECIGGGRGWGARRGGPGGYARARGRNHTGPPRGGAAEGGGGPARSRRPPSRG